MVGIADFLQNNIQSICFKDKHSLSGLTVWCDDAEDFARRRVVAENVQVDRLPVRHDGCDHQARVFDVGHDGVRSERVLQQVFQVLARIRPRADERLLFHPQIEAHALPHRPARAEREGQDAAGAGAGDPVEEMVDRRLPEALYFDQHLSKNQPADAAAVQAEQSASVRAASGVGGVLARLLSGLADSLCVHKTPCFVIEFDQIWRRLLLREHAEQRVHYRSSLVLRRRVDPRSNDGPLCSAEKESLVLPFGAERRRSNLLYWRVLAHGGAQVVCHIGR